MKQGEQVHVAIVGAGGMGSAFGGLLSEGGLRVTLIDVSRAHVDAIDAQGGIRLSGYRGDRIVPIGATTEAASVERADVVFFQCKAIYNRSAAESARHLFRDGRTTGISFQNGLGNEELIGSIVGAGNMLAGQTSLAASLVTPGHVHQFANLPSVIGEMDGSLSERARHWAAIFTQAGLEVHATADVMREKWRKLLANIGYSAISGVTGRTLGEISQTPELRDTALRAIAEAASVAASTGIELSEEEAREIFFQLAAPPEAKPNRSSMRRDIEARRPSEVEQIYEAAIALGERNHVATPTLKTLAALVRGIETDYA